VGGWIASAIFVFISIPFALWGIQSYFGGGGKQVAATVNGTDIPVSVFNEQLQNERRSLAQMFQGKLPKDKFSDADIRNRVIEGMVRNELLQQELDKGGYVVSDEALLKRLGTEPLFLTNGKFDPDRYTRILASRQLSEPGFEASLRQDIRVKEFTDGVSKTA